MIRRAARLILEDVTRTGRGLLAARQLIPWDIQILGRDLLVFLLHVTAVFEYLILVALVSGMVFGVLGLFGWPGVALAVACGVLLLPTVWVTGRTLVMIQGLNEWSPSGPDRLGWATSPLYDRDLDGGIWP